jgi:hypothetical protein
MTKMTPRASKYEIRHLAELERAATVMRGIAEQHRERVMKAMRCTLGELASSPLLRLADHFREVCWTAPAWRSTQLPHVAIDPRLLRRIDQLLGD